MIKHGLKVKVSCNESCKINVALGVSAGTAKRLHILTYFKRCTKVHGKKHCVRAHAYRATTIAGGNVTLKQAGSKTFTLKLSRGVGKTLAKQRKNVKVVLVVSVTSISTHKVVKISKGLTFKP